MTKLWANILDFRRVRKDRRALEWAAVAVCFGLYAGLRVWNLPATLISDKFDEGVYLSLMLAVASGKGTLYRDYILCHPPAVIWAGIWLWPRVRGSISALRLIYIVFCGLALPPVYAIARRRFGAGSALLTLLLLSTTPGLANWFGREIYLDLPLNVPIYAALWILLCARPRRWTGLSANAIVAGMLVGASFIIKETALPAALAVFLGLLWAGRTPDQPRMNRDTTSLDRWTAVQFAVASALVFAIAIACLARIPNYLHDTFTLNTTEVFDWHLRLNELTTGFYALPFLLTFGVAGAVLMARRGRTPQERFLGAFALTLTAIMFFVPRLFYWRYLAGALPVYAIGAAVCLQRLFTARNAMPTRRQPAGWAIAAILLCGIVQVVSLVLYRTHESVNPPAYEQALEILRASPGPLYTLDPIWSAASSQPLTPRVQQLIKVTAHVSLSSDEATAAADDCPTVLLDRTSLRWLPPVTLERIRTDYRTVFRSGNVGSPGYLEVLSYAKRQRILRGSRPDSVR